MLNRRKFLTKASISSLAALLGTTLLKNKTFAGTPGGNGKTSGPLVISTWNHGLAANDEAMQVILEGGRAVDAVEAGVKIPEADPNNLSVGLGGLPDRDGKVTLDACIMDEFGNCGSVCFLEHIVHPISVARLVMDDTPHIMLAGSGALQFALGNGFEKKNLLTEKAKKAWEKWKITSKYEPVPNSENHDTIGLIAIDQKGNLSGACTTSGMAFKIRGRVGDSPIIGAGLYVDNEVGGATATGTGELVIRTVGTFLVVELMRHGRSPQEACEEAIRRIAQSNIPDINKHQVGYIAVNKAGETGAFCLQPGFNYAVHKDGKNELIESGSYFR
jgi:isoaspartyl peptidase/L-asparaginase-like protein (Ntn-hydrolase superfamily)